MTNPTSYAELHCLSPFSFLRGASHADELFARAKQQGYQALAITDDCTLAGIVRAHEASLKHALPLIVGSEFKLQCGLRLVLLVENFIGYRRLCQLISHARRAADKGQYQITRADFFDLTGLITIALPAQLPSVATEQLQWLKQTCNEQLYLAIELHRGARDHKRRQYLLDLAIQHDIRPVACGDVHMHIRARRALQDTLCAIRHRCTLTEAGDYLFPNGERHLRSITQLQEIYGTALMQETLHIAQRCQFSLSELRYEYPHEVLPQGLPIDLWLQHLVTQGSQWRWPAGVPEKAQKQIDHELRLIHELGYEAYFLTVHDIVRHARSIGILCQGRGSAANSAVCFALGITEIDPSRSNLLFERFISRERNEPPDIDVDFEHERREEVIQYIYQKYGRERAALAATVICYRGKSAAREVGKALGFSHDEVEQLSKVFSWWNGETAVDDRLREYGFDPDSAVLRRAMGLIRELIDLPKHLSQHVGGFVISERPLYEIVPIENAAMPDRTIIQWDKDDLDTMGLMKIDCLALGMLTAVRKCLDLLRQHRGLDLSPASIPAEDPATYQMIQKADTVGVFQIESRAQQAMLPRLKPSTFYDLVIEVAIVRPGPIQGKMVHPYLRRRQGLEKVENLSPELNEVFARTLGVPLFQEQVMQLTVVAAGFTPGEADHLRRSMAAWKRRGDLAHFRDRIRSGMIERGYEAAFADQVFEQIRGFGSYGFPESHAASFALITYVSCWLKCHEPAAFTCALINSQPLGFYSNAQLVQDLRRHGVEVRPVDVRFSAIDCTLESSSSATRDRTKHESSSSATKLGTKAQPALRIGLKEINGLTSLAMQRIVQCRSQRHFSDVIDLCERADLNSADRDALAESGALRGLAGHRHRAMWAVRGVDAQLPLFGTPRFAETPVTITPPSAYDNVRADYQRVGISLGPHPILLVRKLLSARRCIMSDQFKRLQHGSAIRFAGIVTLRQRPETASGVTFITLEDEHGMVNVVVWSSIAERQRRVMLESQLMAVDGRLESADGVQHLIAKKLYDYSDLLQQFALPSRDFH